MSTQSSDIEHESAPLTEAEIRESHIGEPVVLNGTIFLAEYDSSWPDAFRAQETRIRQALGDRIIRLEHVGSTSVPGLAAKPVIDILLVVADSAEETSYVPALEAHGYELHIREPKWFEHRLLKWAEPKVNLHVLSAGCPEVDRMLLFRDHLRSNESDRKLYEHSKRELAGRTWRYGQNYADAKGGVVAEIMSRCRRERRVKTSKLDGAGD